MRNCHLVARTCDNEVGVAISIRDPYTSPFTSWCKFARCLLLVRCLCSETIAIGFLSSVEPNFVERTALGSLKRRRSYSEVSKRRHNFGTKRFKEKSLFIFHARIALKSLILLFVRLIARGARIGKTHRQTDRQTDRQTHRQNEYCNPRACAPRVNDKPSTVTLANKPLTFDVGLIQLSFIPVCSLNTCNISVKLCRGFALQYVLFILSVILSVCPDTLFWQYVRLKV